MFQESRTTFSCYFDNIGQYPFKEQTCGFSLYLRGTPHDYMHLRLGQFNDKSPKLIGQYVVKKWIWENSTDEKTNKNVIRVSVVLTRDFYSIFLVTYLPTIFMNIINQVSNYINSKSKVINQSCRLYLIFSVCAAQYDLIFTLNITCMMVLASVYLSVSTSLPSSSNIKPVEIWLLFNLFYPFLGRLRIISIENVNIYS